MLSFSNQKNQTTSSDANAMALAGNLFRSFIGTAIAVLFVMAMLHQVNASESHLSANESQPESSASEVAEQESEYAQPATESINNTDPSIQPPSETQENANSFSIANTPENSTTTLDVDISTSSSTNTSTDDSGGESSKPTADVLLNGEEIELTRNGRYRERTDNGTTETDIKLDIDIESNDNSSFRLDINE